MRLAYMLTQSRTANSPINPFHRHAVLPQGPRPLGLQFDKETTHNSCGGRAGRKSNLQDLQSASTVSRPFMWCCFLCWEWEVADDAVCQGVEACQAILRGVSGACEESEGERAVSLADMSW